LHHKNLNEYTQLSHFDEYFEVGDISIHISLFSRILHSYGGV